MLLLHNNIIRSKGPNNNRYSHKKTEIPSRKEEIIHIIQNANDVVFIRTGSSSKIKDLDFFSTNLDELKKPTILITSDGDRPTPSSYNQQTVQNILDSPNIKIWYTQNYDKSILHPKLQHFPIGFDLHTPQWLINNNIQKKIEFMIECRKKSPTNKRISNKIFSDSHSSYTHVERKILYKKLQNNQNISFNPERKSFTEITQEYNKYNFVLSPRGNGLDCHRTWELFLAGVIVITKTTTLDDMFTNNNLPVVILKDWDELNENLEHKLQNWYKMHIDKTEIDHIFPRLTFDFWLNYRDF